MEGPHLGNKKDLKVDLASKWRKYKRKNYAGGRLWAVKKIKNSEADKNNIVDVRS